MGVGDDDEQRDICRVRLVKRKVGREGEIPVLEAMEGSTSAEEEEEETAIYLWAPSGSLLPSKV